MNILISGNDILQMNALESIIKAYKKQWKIFKTCSFTDAVAIIEQKNIHLFFIYIESEKNSEKNSLKFAKNVRRISKYENVPIIFITSFKEQIFRAINSIHCFNYIISPFAASDVYKAIDGIDYITTNEKDTITIRDGNSIYFTIPYCYILYIESVNHNAVFHTAKSSFQYNNQPLGSILGMLDARFVRIHKKYIINTDHITNYDKTNQYITVGGFHLTVGRTFKKEFETSFLMQSIDSIKMPQ